jgi:glycerol kinase
LAKYIGAIDQGTTSTRFIVFDRSGGVVSISQKEHQQIFPQPGWVEHDAQEIWVRTLEVVAAAMNQAGLTSGDLAAIGITNQRETTVVWNRKTGKPVCNALVWQDTRVAEYLPTMEKHPGQDRLRRKTGLPLATYFSGLKIRWILENIKGVRELAEKGEVIFGNVDSFLVWQLTGGIEGGVHVTDVTNASRTQLMDLDTLSWDAETLDALGIPAAMLPRICSSSEVYGLARMAAIAEVPIAGILGDQQGALVGQACFERGEAKNTYGTGCFLLMNTGTEKILSKSGLITTVAYKFGAQPVHYALEGSIAMAGALVQWVRDNLGLIQTSSEIEKLANSVTDNGGVYFVPAFAGLYAPYWNEGARGVIAGLTRYANRGHIARAVLESTAYQTRDVLEAIEEDSGIALDTLRADGGMVSDEVFMQFQADILNRPVVRPRTKDATTAIGAAYAAGLAVQYFESTEDLRRNWAIDRTWIPRLAQGKREDLYRHWKRAVTRSFDWLD